MGKLSDNKEQKRRAILDAAQEIFLSEGYVLAGMDRIAARAEVTKQTVYRYFPSKIVLFEETLKHMGSRPGEAFLKHLENPDIPAALNGFAAGFITAHLSSSHLDTFRLLVAESAKAPEITRTFFAVGPDHTGEALTRFFKERLNAAEPETLVRQWTGMLLAHRSSVLAGMPPPDRAAIDAYARDCTDFLLAALRPAS